MCVRVCAEVEIRSRFRRFSRSFGQNRKNRTTPARVQNLKMGKKKKQQNSQEKQRCKKNSSFPKDRKESDREL